jgi:hypothetical protein
MKPKTAEALVVLAGGLWGTFGLILVYKKGWEKEGAVVLASGAILSAFVAAIRAAA